ncbi:MAG: hypothetical protein WDW38_010701 [Sanguina aurantia]
MRLLGAYPPPLTPPLVRDYGHPTTTTSTSPSPPPLTNTEHPGVQPLLLPCPAEDDATGHSCCGRPRRAAATDGGSVQRQGGVCGAQPDAGRARDC